MTLNIVKAKDVLNNKLQMIVWGPSGVGKTPFAATAPKTLIISVDGGVSSIRDTDAEVQEVHDWKTAKEIKNHVMGMNHGFETIVIDHGTALQRIHQEHLLKKSGQAQMRQNDWGEHGNEMYRYVHDLFTLPINLILVMMEKESTNDDGGTAAQIAFQGSALPIITGLFDLIAYMVAEEQKDDAGKPMIDEQGRPVVKRALRFAPTKKVQLARDRNYILQAWEKPDFPAIHEKIFGNKKEKK